MLRCKSIALLIYFALQFNIAGKSQTVTPAAPHKEKYNWLFAVGVGTTYSYGDIAGEKKIETDLGSVETVSKFSHQWPMSESKTGISATENFFRKFSFSLDAEKKITPKNSYSIGLISSSRYFNIIERFTGGDGNERYIYRNLHTLSAPLAVHNYAPLSSGVSMKQSFGLSPSIAFSKNSSWYYYKTTTTPNFFLTLDFGFELLQANNSGFAVSAFYKQGLFDMLDDKISPVTTMDPVAVSIKTYNVNSKGSCFQLQLKYYIWPQKIKVFNKKKEAEKVAPVPTPPPAPKKIIKIPDNAEVLERIELPDTGKFHICIRDYLTPDGDSVSVYFNGELVVEDYELVREEKCLEIYPKKGVNQIVIYPLNEGRIRPNTSRLIVRQSNIKMRETVLRTNAEKPLIIELVIQ
jgi:hypothetical protein